MATPSYVWSQIAGRVQSDNGTALSGATVEAWSSYPGGSILQSGTTNAQGEFSLPAIGPGHFDLRVWRQINVGPGIFKATHFPTVVRALPHPTTNTMVRLVSVPTVATNPISTCDLSDTASLFLATQVSLGDVIEGVDLTGHVCGVTRATGDGNWLGHVYGDDPTTADTVEGPSPGDALGFRINGLAATATNGPVIFSGTFGCNKTAQLAGATSVEGVTLTAPLDATGSAGGNGPVLLVIKNTGGVSASYTVEVEVDQPWNVLIQAVNGLNVNLAPGASQDVLAQIQIPPGTPDQNVEVRARVTSDTYGEANSGAWTMLSVSTTSGVGHDGDGLIPNRFSLAQNYPNPFNAGTNIGFAIEKGGQVNLTVCNLLGQTVRTLLNGYRDPGVYTEAWDGRDEHGTSVPSGIYFSRLIQNSQTQVRKMVLLK
jgi:hypothetical protein